ncbi:hypothetical protein [Nocardia sp. Marseille-Q1738]
MNFEVHHPYFLLAGFNDDGVFVVFRSTVVRLDSDLYAPVQEFLEKHEHELISMKTYESQDWMGNEMELTTYRILGTE